ncbi:MAG TPA: hypothetical protein VGP80_02390 [Gemmatimonadales bacterium]|nr:hypothetical protein [Gemmatimonadales bacterium]
MILTPHYLFVHIPGRGQLTLSLPGGFERAFRYDRLPEDALLWHSAAGVWLPILRHPAIVRLREAALSEAYDYDFEFAPREPLEQNEPVFAQLNAPDPVPELPELPLPVESAAVESDHPELLPLIKVSDWKTHLAEFSRLVARSTAQEERRRSSRLSVGIRPRESGPMFFAGVAAPVEDPLEVEPRTLARFRVRLLTGACLLLLAMGLGGWLWYRTPSATLAIDSARAHVLSARERDSLARASSGSNVQIAAATPLADLEAELESDLRIADAVIWQPAIDFASEDQVVRSTRKLDAVRNSIGLYRLGAWRIADSLARETDPRLEPFEEADRVDAVVKTMDAALTFLHSVVGHYRVSGDLLVFERGEDAEHYNTIARMADSLVRAPVELDSFPAIRPPRRVVTRLLATLPSAVAPSPSQP